MSFTPSSNIMYKNEFIHLVINLENLSYNIKILGSDGPNFINLSFSYEQNSPTDRVIKWTLLSFIKNILNSFFPLLENKNEIFDYILEELREYEKKTIK